MARDFSFERAIRFAAELIRIPSLPGHGGEVARRIVDELRELGFGEARTDRAGNVVARIAGTGATPAVMLRSHIAIQLYAATLFLDARPPGAARQPAGRPVVPRPALVRDAGEPAFTA